MLLLDLDNKKEFRQGLHLCFDKQGTSCKLHTLLDSGKQQEGKLYLQRMQRIIRDRAIRFFMVKAWKNRKCWKGGEYFKVTRSASSLNYSRNTITRYENNGRAEMKINKIATRQCLMKLFSTRIYSSHGTRDIKTILKSVIRRFRVNYSRNVV